MQLQAGPSYSQSYHQLHQAQQALASADHELKRTYLSLLPPPQVIDICLTFDFHVPLYAKTSIWPIDLNAAIHALRKSHKASSSTDDPSKNERKKDALPVMDSLTEPADGSSSPESSHDDQPSASKQSESMPASALSIPQPPTSTGTPTGTHHPPPQPPPIVGYPHHRYAYPSQHAYPHTPYYPPNAWPYIPYPPPPLHATPYHHHPPPGYPPPLPPPQPQQPTVTLANQPVQDTPNSNMEDLPSYEDMIVEALNDGVEDPEGLAPKDLWVWVAAHYPVQSNFRPSAGQALQKAFRRGRFEKSDSGKYRLNPEWKGGTTTRRPTRRPQTLNTPSTPSPSQPSQPRPPPFTKTPLVQQPAQTTFSSKRPFGYGVPGHPASDAQFRPNALASCGTQEDSGDLGDAYEAARHILKTINFGAMLKMDVDDDEEEAAHDVLTDPPTNASNNATPVASSAAQDATASGKTIATKRPPSSQPINDVEHGIRAGLQAYLALLAAQLSELSQEMPAQDELAPHVGDAERQASRQDAAELLIDPDQIPEADLGDSDDEEMDEVVC